MDDFLNTLQAEDGPLSRAFGSRNISQAPKIYRSDHKARVKASVAKNLVIHTICQGIAVEVPRHP